MVKVCAFLLLLPALQAATSKITHESIWLMKRVGAPIASPDGKWVVFPVVEPAYNEANQVSDLVDRTGRWKREASPSHVQQRRREWNGLESG